jgi:hypothetical protein
MIILIENGLRSLAYVSVTQNIGDKPIEVRHGVKTYEVALKVIVSSLPQKTEEDDVIGNCALGPGQIAAVELESDPMAVAFTEGDPAIGTFGIEDVLDDDEGVHYRIVAADENGSGKGSLH